MFSVLFLSLSPCCFFFRGDGPHCLAEVLVQEKGGEKKKVCFGRPIVFGAGIPDGCWSVGGWRKFDAEQLARLPFCLVRPCWRCDRPRPPPGKKEFQTAHCFALAIKDVCQTRCHRRRRTGHLWGLLTALAHTVPPPRFLPRKKKVRICTTPVCCFCTFARPSSDIRSASAGVVTGPFCTLPFWTRGAAYARKEKKKKRECLSKTPTVFSSRRYRDLRDQRATSQRASGRTESPGRRTRCGWVWGYAREAIARPPVCPDKPHGYSHKVPDSSPVPSAPNGRGQR